jgi:hypothetical protein
MSREKHRFLVPPPRDKRGGSGVAGVAAGDPRLDVLQSGPLRGRQAVTLGMVKATRQAVAALARELGAVEGLAGKFARDRVRSIEHTLSILERVARLPADPAADYTGLDTP